MLSLLFKTDNNSCTLLPKGARNRYFFVYINNQSKIIYALINRKKYSHDQTHRKANYEYLHKRQVKRIRLTCF